MKAGFEQYVTLIVSPFLTLITIWSRFSRNSLVVIVLIVKV